MKHIILLCSIVVCLLSMDNCAQAQKVKVGVRAGAGVSTWTAYEDTKYDPLRGVAAGAYGNIFVNELLSFEAGLYYSKKGAEFNRIYERAEEDVYLFLEQHTRYALYYLDFPVLARLTVWKGLSVCAGPQFSYLVYYTKKEKGRSILNGEKHSHEMTYYDKSMYNRLDLGIVAGLGYRFNNGLNVNGTYGYGLYKVYKESWGGEEYNRSVNISLGYLF